MMCYLIIIKIMYIATTEVIFMQQKWYQATEVEVDSLGQSLHFYMETMEVSRLSACFSIPLQLAFTYVPQQKTCL